jgi:hypothetical protein
VSASRALLTAAVSVLALWGSPVMTGAAGAQWPGPNEGWITFDAAPTPIDAVSVSVSAHFTFTRACPEGRIGNCSYSLHVSAQPASAACAPYPWLYAVTYWQPDPGWEHGTTRSYPRTWTQRTDQGPQKLCFMLLDGGVPGSDWQLLDVESIPPAGAGSSPPPASTPPTQTPEPVTRAGPSLTRARAIRAYRAALERRYGRRWRRGTARRVRCQRFDAGRLNCRGGFSYRGQRYRTKGAVWINSTAKVIARARPH